MQMQKKDRVQLWSQKNVRPLPSFGLSFASKTVGLDLLTTTTRISSCGQVGPNALVPYATSWVGWMLIHTTRSHPMEWDLESLKEEWGQVFHYWVHHSIVSFLSRLLLVLIVLIQGLWFSLWRGSLLNRAWIQLLLFTHHHGNRDRVTITCFGQCGSCGGAVGVCGYFFFSIFKYKVNEEMR